MKSENAQEVCPVQHTASTQGCPVQHSSGPLNQGCPVDKEARSGMMDALGVGLADKESMQAGTESSALEHNTAANDMAFGQSRYPGQKIPLSTDRVTSTIPNVKIFALECIWIVY